jgi:hypothetical protein
MGRHHDIDVLMDDLDHVRETFMGVVGDLQSMIKKVKKNTTDPEYDRPQLVDLGFLCREIAAISDELRKEANAKQMLIGKVIAMEVTRASLAGEISSPTVRGELATGTPDVREIASCPKPGTPQFREVAEFLGLPEAEVDGRLFSLRFTGLSDWLTQMAAEGKEVPKAINRYTEFKTIFRRTS